MNSLITPELSDSLLNFLTSSISLGDDKELLSTDFPKPEGLTNDALDVLLYDLQTAGLISINSSSNEGNPYFYDISITKRALDFQRHGGFVGQEVMFKQNVEKLLLEIEKLKPSSSEQAEKIASIVGNISAFLGLILTYKSDRINLPESWADLVAS